jgi:hypothetical protein
MFIVLFKPINAVRMLGCILSRVNIPKVFLCQAKNEWSFTQQKNVSMLCGINAYELIIAAILLLKY